MVNAGPPERLNNMEFVPPLMVSESAPVPGCNTRLPDDEAIVSEESPRNVVAVVRSSDDPGARMRSCPTTVNWKAVLVGCACKMLVTRFTGVTLLDGVSMTGPFWACIVAFAVNTSAAPTILHAMGGPMR